MSNPSDNLKDLFEVPVLFYALALYLFVTGRVDAAWVFVSFRALRSAVQCTFDPVMLRFYLYLIAALEVRFMVVRAGLAHFGGQRAFDDLRTGRSVIA